MREQSINFDYVHSMMEYDYIKKIFQFMKLRNFIDNTKKSLWPNLMIIPAIATYLLIEKYFISVSNSEGASMQPTIKSGDLIIVDHFFYKYFGGLKKDDIIVATQPVDASVSICKRIIETGGHQVPHKPGIIVPEDFYWVEGDNTHKSYDSRHHGCIPKNLVKGKVVYVIPM